MANVTTGELVIAESEKDDVDVQHEIVSTYKTIGERFSYYDVILINSASDPSIQNAMNAYNYTSEEIASGKALLENARKADATNAKEYGEQYAAYENVEKEYKEAARPYMDSLKVARIVFGTDRNATKALALNGRRSTKLPEWLRDTETFYRNLLNTPEYQMKMVKRGRTREKIEAEYKEAKDVIGAYAGYQKEAGEAQESTAIRDKKVEELDIWMSEFIGIARIALQDNPDSLKKLGI